MDMKQLDSLLSDIADELENDARWYEDKHSPGLTEQCRYAQRAVLDVAELIHAECKTLDDVDELLENMRVDALSTYKFLQLEHFDHLAELAMISYLELIEISDAIERNK